MRKVFVVFLVLFLFGLRVSFLPRPDLKEGQKVRVTGVLSEEPQVSGNIQKFKLGQIEVVTQRYPEYHYGDEIEAVGGIKIKNKISNIKNSRVLNNSTTSVIPASSWNLYRFRVKHGMTILKTLFNSLKNSNKKLNILKREEYQLSFPKISLVYPAKSGARLDIEGWAIKLRQNLREVYRKVFISPYDGIVAGVVIGDKSLIPKDFYKNLKKTGTLHILVASGMNIALFSSGVLSFFCIFFKRQISVLLLILLIWFYSLITGMQPPIIRAAIMASLLYLSEFFGRQKDSEKILWLTGLIMVFSNPYLVSDVGFQLSFLATAGLVWIRPLIKEKIMSLREVPMDIGTTKQSPVEKRDCFGVKPLAMTIIQSDNFTSSFSAQIATLPILLSAFGQFNLLSPIVNLLILWTIPYILQIGAILGILGLFGTIGFGLAKIASFPFTLLLLYLEQAINWSAKITFFQVQISRIGAWWVAGYYLILIFWIKKRNKFSMTN